ncbi:MAG: AI-2E family transporter [Acidobacteriota bacterium]
MPDSTSIPPQDDQKSISVRPEHVRPPFTDKRIESRRNSQSKVLTGSVIVVVILYFARAVFIPMALAILFAFLLRPIVTLLEKTFLRRTLSVIISLAVALTIVSLGTWSLAQQVNSLAKEIAGYSGNLQNKLHFLHVNSGRTIALVEHTIEKVTEPTQKADRPDLKVRIVPDKLNVLDRYEAIAPTAEFVAAAFLVIFLVYFLLKEREQLRDKMLRMAGRANLTVTTQAIGETTFRISRYLLTLALINSAYGAVIWIGLTLLRVPHAPLWGVLATLLRFVPYVGPVISAALPTLLALAAFPNWFIPAAVLGLFILADQVLAGFIEPAVIGNRVGVSPIALLVAAIFWGWLWGPVGLLLATPITVCLTVAGEFIPALQIFSIMFGTEAPLEGYLSYYNRLLTRDRAGASALADRYAEVNSLEATFNDLFIPTLAFAQEELQRERITKINDNFIKDTTRELIVRIGDRAAMVQATNPRVVAAPVAGERLSLGTLMLTQLLRGEGYRADYMTDLDAQEVRSYVEQAHPAAVFVSCSRKDNLELGYELLGILSSQFPGLVLIAGGSAFTSDDEKTTSAGATYVPRSLSAAKEDILREIRRSRRRTGKTSLSHSPSAVST